jgi:hypothetical protein
MTYPKPSEAQRFKNWMIGVNEALYRICGMTSDDMPDYPYYDTFTSGFSPMGAAKDVLIDQGMQLEEPEEDHELMPEVRGSDISLQ